MVWLVVMSCVRLLVLLFLAVLL